MSTITKVFCPVSYLYCQYFCVGVVVTFMAKVNDYKERYEEQKIKADAASVMAYAAEEQLSKTVNNYGQTAELTNDKIKLPERTVQYYQY